MQSSICYFLIRFLISRPPFLFSSFHSFEQSVKV
uniref:Uncharacterized protein n=1 Tax=Rhizophora mucronata TaxID=61149 RepID=A0A2P2IHZ1_RHIMU